MNGVQIIRVLRMFFYFITFMTTYSLQIKAVLDEIIEKLPEMFNMLELMSKVEPADRTPYVVVAFQECERMNTLTNEIRSAYHGVLKSNLLI